MAKLPEEGYVVSIGTEGYWVSDGFAELLIQLLQYGDTSNVILTTKTAIQDEKMKLLSDIHSLSIENKRLKEELDFVRGDNTKFEEDVKQLKNDLEESQRNNIELAADVKALEAKLVNATHGRKQMEWDALVAENQELIQKNFELDSQVNTLKKSRDGYRDCLQQKLQEENDKLRQENKEISDNIKKLRTQCSTSVGQRNKYYELYKQLMVENRRLHRGFAVLDLDNFIKEGVRERCFKLQAENEELKTQSSSLQKENVRLVKELEDLQKKNEYLSGSIEKVRDIHAKEKTESKEQLEASSDLTMANELANIFGEYTDAEQKNHNILIGKLAKFQDKHKLICVAGELKRG